MTITFGDPESIDTIEHLEVGGTDPNFTATTTYVRINSELRLGPGISHGEAGQVLQSGGAENPPVWTTAAVDRLDGEGHSVHVVNDNGVAVLKTTFQGNDSYYVKVRTSDITAFIGGSSGELIKVELQGGVPRLLWEGASDPNMVHVRVSDQTGLLIGGGHNIYAVNSGGVPQLRCNTGPGAPNNVHVYYADISNYASYLQDDDASIELWVADESDGPRLRVNYKSAAGDFFPNYNHVRVAYADTAGSVDVVDPSIFSDDRIKWNETIIDKNRSTNIIKDINFYNYDILSDVDINKEYKYDDKFEPDKCIKHCGVIAQEIKKLSEKYPELKDCVNEEKNVMGVNYFSILSIMGSSVQKLIERVELLETKLEKYESL